MTLLPDGQGAVPGSGYEDRPDYRVDFLRRRNHVVVKVGNLVLASSVGTTLVDEQDHGLVFYFPAGDVHWDQVTPMAGRASTCPFKGEARYFAMTADPKVPVAWCYDHPHVQVAAIAGHVAFYQDRVTLVVGAAA